MSLRIGRFIKYALGQENAPRLHETIGGRLFPVQLPEDTSGMLPWAWYYSVSMSGDETKDGYAGDSTEVQIEAVAETYEKLLDILALIRKGMADARRNWDDKSLKVADMSFRAGPEEYDDTLQAYCRKLIYTIDTYEQIT